MFVDTHTHSFFSFDSEMAMEAAISSAQYKGLSGIVFTDHVDIDIPGCPEILPYSMDEYFGKTERMRDIFGRGNTFKILRGAEVGIQKNTVDKTLKYISGYEFDQIIGSVHYIGGKDPYEPEYYTGRKKEDVYSEYFYTLYELTDCGIDFDILGHFDYIAKFAVYDDPLVVYEDYGDILDSILKKLVSKDIALEINTSVRRSVSLYRELLSRYGKFGGEMISLASDAHTEAYIGRCFKEISQIIKSCGFDYVVHFEKRKPVFDKI